MGFRWTQKNISPIAVDFGSDCLKLLQVQLDDPPQIIAAAAAEIPDSARRDADAHRQFVTGALRDLLRDGGFRGKRVVASISAAHTYIQHVRLARSEGAVLQEQIDTELRGRLPLDPSALVIRHVNVGDVFADGASKQEVICLAASREWVMRCVGTVRAAGFEVVGMHCEPMAILESFSHLFRRSTDGARSTFFIDIGAATTKALIAHGRDLVFAKAIHVGGDHFVSQLARQLNVSISEAKQRRAMEIGGVPHRPVQRGVTATTDQGLPMIDSVAAEKGGRRFPTPQPVPATAAAIAAPAVATEPQHAATTGAPSPVETPAEMLDALIDDLQLCVGYHASMFQDRPLDKIVFLGGESRNTRMCQRIAQALRLPAQLGDPMARLTRPLNAGAVTAVDLTQGQPGWAVPVGLCLLPTNL